MLVSWAVPNDLPEDPAASRLAIGTEDHPPEYASFEGVIPPGQYGIGSGRQEQARYKSTQNWPIGMWTCPWANPQVPRTESAFGGGALTLVLRR